MDDQTLTQLADPSEPGTPLPLPYLSPWKPLRRLTVEGAAVVACRTLALWAAVQVLQSLTYSLFMLVLAMANSSWSSFRLSEIAPQLVLLPQLVGFGVAGAVLWFKAEWLSERITRLLPADAIPDNAVLHEEPKLSVRSPTDDAAPLLSILLMAIGVFVLAEAVSELGRALTAPLHTRRSDYEEAWASVILGSPFFWPAIIKCAIGGWLTLGPRGIARLILKLRKTYPPAQIHAVDSPDGSEAPMDR